ncbi:HNH endonuclease [Wolffia australiana]
MSSRRESSRGGGPVGGGGGVSLGSPRRRRRQRGSPSSPRSSSSSSAAVVEVAGEEYELYVEQAANPRSFSHSVKAQCWDKAEKVKGRDPDRWRRDYLGNVLFRKLVGCPGCYCHDYDHITPFSKGGLSTLDNCQVLRASVNRAKGNKTEISKAELIQMSVRRTPACRAPSDREMDFMELSAYGDIRRSDGPGGCFIQ